MEEWSGSSNSFDALWQKDGAVICRKSHEFLVALFSCEQSLRDNSQRTVIEQTLVILCSRTDKMWCSATLTYRFLGDFCRLGQAVESVSANLPSGSEDIAKKFWKELAATDGVIEKIGDAGQSNDTNTSQKLVPDDRIADAWV